MKMDNLIFGLEVLVIGFIVVMITLYLLYLILLGFSRCCVRPAKPEPKSDNTLPPPATLAEVAAAPVAATATGPLAKPVAGENYEIVAAITAAIAACLETSPSHFQVVSIQPAVPGSGPGAWALSGRKKLMERRDLNIFRRERRT